MIWFACVMLAVLLLLYWLAPRNFFNVYVSGFVFGLLALIILIYILPDITSEEQFVSRFYIILLFAIIPLILCGLSILTFFNGKILLEKEGRRTKNLLFSAIGVVMDSYRDHDRMDDYLFIFITSVRITKRDRRLSRFLVQ